MSAVGPQKLKNGNGPSSAVSRSRTVAGERVQMRSVVAEKGGGQSDDVDDGSGVHGGHRRRSEQTPPLHTLTSEDRVGFELLRPIDGRTVREIRHVEAAALREE